jgi:hypothetical protein
MPANISAWIVGAATRDGVRELDLDGWTEKKPQCGNISNHSPIQSCVMLVGTIPRVVLQEYLGQLLGLEVYSGTASEHTGCDTC